MEYARFEREIRRLKLYAIGCTALSDSVRRPSLLDGYRAEVDLDDLPASANLG